MSAKFKSSKKKDNLLNMIRRIYERFIKIRGRPREIALGFALGIFIGMTPTMGIQMPIAIFFAAMFKWSKISAAFGVWITNPLTSPFIYSITYIVGVKLLGLQATLILPDDLTWSIVKEILKNAPVIFGALMVGGIIIGLPLAILSYYLSYTAVNKYQQRIKDKMAAQKARLVITKDSVKNKIRKRKKKSRHPYDNFAYKNGCNGIAVCDPETTCINPGPSYRLGENNELILIYFCGLSIDVIADSSGFLQYSKCLLE